MRMRPRDGVEALRSLTTKAGLVLGPAIARVGRPPWARRIAVLPLLGVLVFTFVAGPIPELPPGRWDAFLGTGAQVIGAAIAIVFALLVVPVQNAAGRYSPVFLRYISRDAQLPVCFGWGLVGLAYALAAQALGATPWRVAMTGVLTMSVFLSLAIAANRVLHLVNPINLAHMVQRHLQVRIEHVSSGDAASFEKTLAG